MGGGLKWEGLVVVLFLNEGLEIHHGVQLLGAVAQQGLQVADKPADDVVIAISCHLRHHCHY